MPAVSKLASMPIRARYSTYRPSGVDWIGDVPDTWSQRRLKFCARLVNLKIDASSSELPYVGMENIESNTGRSIGRNAETNVEGLSNLFEPGDVLFGKLRPYLAKALHARVKGLCSSELLVYRPTGLVAQFLLYQMLSDGFIETVDASTYGAKMPRASAEFIGNLPIVFPSAEEQQAIAGFLDRETARIDELIGKKQRLIELLAEKRTALISHAVTKGLDPGAAMKDSGIEWPAQIPSTWAMHQLRRVVKKFVDYRGRTPTKTDSGVPLITAGAVRHGRIDHARAPEYIAEDDYQDWMCRGWPEIDDLVITTEAPLAEVALVEDVNVALAQRIILFKLNRSRVLPEWLRYYYISNAGRAELLSRASGSTASGIRADRLRMSLVIIPPLEEQCEIVNYLNPRIAAANAVLDPIRNAITALREYRSALISAAVTGKIDVREKDEV